MNMKKKQNLLNAWKKIYNVRKKGEETYELTLSFMNANDMKPYYVTTRDFLHKINHLNIIKGTEEFTFLLRVVFEEDDFYVNRIIAFERKLGRRSCFLDYTHVEYERWIAKQQLLKDAGLPLDYRYFNWEEMYETLQTFPFPEECHERTQEKDWLLMHPLIQINTEQYDAIKILEYKHASENFGHSLFLYEDRSWRIDYLPKKYASLEEAWEAFEALLKKERLQFLF